MTTSNARAEVVTRWNLRANIATAILWTAMLPVTFLTPLAGSVPYLSFLSVYALIQSSAAGIAAAYGAKRQEES